MYKLKYQTNETDKDIFKKWFITSEKSFLVRHNSSFMFDSFDNWIRRCDHAHEDVREVLGTDIVNVDVEIKDSQSPVNWDEYPEMKAEIQANLFNFFKHYRYDIDFLSTPTYQKNSHSTIKVGKFIRSYYAQVGNNEKLKSIEVLLSKVGDIWAKHRTGNRSGCLTVSTKPKGFILLGHYKPDNDSCFREGSTSPRDKFVLAQTKDTIVVTLSEYKEDKKKHINIARSFGFIDTDNKNVHVTNCYCEKGIPEGDLIALYKDGFEKLFNKDLCYTEGKIRLNRERHKVYPNEFGRWSFIGSLYDKFVQPATNLWGLYDNHCPETGIYATDDSKWRFIDDKWCAPEAQELANECLVSGKLSFRSMKKIKDEDGSEALVLDKYYNEVPVCEETGERCISLEMTPDGKKISSYLFNQKYEECEATGEMVPVEDIVDLLGYSVSKKSIENKIFPFDEDEINQIAMVYNTIEERQLKNV